MDDRSEHEAFLNRGDDIGAFIERGKLNLAFLAGLANDFNRQRRVVFKEAGHQREIGVLDHHVFDVRLRLRAIERIGPRADDRVTRFGEDLRRLVVARWIGRAAKETVDEALTTALRVVLLEATDEDRDLATLAALTRELAAHEACVVVVHADVAKTRRVRRIGIVRDEEALLGDEVHHLGLIRRVDRADGDAVDALDDEVFEHALLVAEAAAGELDGDVAIDVLRLTRRDGACLRDRPEVGDAVRNERDVRTLLRSRLVCRNAFLLRRDEVARERCGGEQAEAEAREGNDGNKLLHGAFLKLRGAVNRPSCRR